MNRREKQIKAIHFIFVVSFVFVVNQLGIFIASESTRQHLFQQLFHLARVLLILNCILFVSSNSLPDKRELSDIRRIVCINVQTAIMIWLTSISKGPNLRFLSEPSRQSCPKFSRSIYIFQQRYATMRLNFQVWINEEQYLMRHHLTTTLL